MTKRWPTASGRRRIPLENGDDGSSRIGLLGLYDEPRVGGPRKVTDEQVEEIVVRTLERNTQRSNPLEHAENGQQAGISAMTVSRIWRAHGLKPHVVRGFKLSNDPQFIEKVRDIVGLYMSPPANAVVYCFDEKSGVVALERAQPILPMDIGRPERRTHTTFDMGHSTCSRLSM